MYSFMRLGRHLALKFGISHTPLRKLPSFLDLLPVLCASFSAFLRPDLFTIVRLDHLPVVLLSNDLSVLRLTRVCAASGWGTGGMGSDCTRGREMTNCVALFCEAAVIRCRLTTLPRDWTTLRPMWGSEESDPITAWAASTSSWPTMWTTTASCFNTPVDMVHWYR